MWTLKALQDREMPTANINGKWVPAKGIKSINLCKDNLIVNAPPLREAMIVQFLIKQPQELSNLLAAAKRDIRFYSELIV